MGAAGRRRAVHKRKSHEFNDVRVTYKLWGVILGLLLLLLGTATWIQLRGRYASDATEQMVAKYEDAITQAVRWRGMGELAVSLNMVTYVTTDTAVRDDLDKQVAALTARITPVQELITKNATSDIDKAAMDAVAKTRADIRGLGDKTKEIKASTDVAMKQAFLDKEYRPRAKVYLESLDKFVAAQEQQRDASRKELAEVRAQLVVVAVVAVAVVFGLGSFHGLGAGALHHAAAGQGGVAGPRRLPARPDPQRARRPQGRVRRADARPVRHGEPAARAGDAGARRGGVGLHRPRVKSRRGTMTCPAAPKARPARWRKPPLPWKS